MTSKQALENIRDFKPFGYDTTHKEEYALSGTLNDYLQEELSIIKKDLEIFEIIKKYWNIEINNSQISISYKATSPIDLLPIEEIKKFKEYFEK